VADKETDCELTPVPFNGNDCAALVAFNVLSLTVKLSLSAPE